MHTSRGITLLELICTVSIVGVLTTLSVPTFTTMSRNSSRAAAVNELFHALFLARSEAIKRNSTVSVCRSLDGRTCTNTTAGWAAGWIVFDNRDRDDPPQVDVGETIMHASAGWASGRITSNRKAYSFRPYAQGVVNGTLTFCDERGSEQARAIIISQTGRPRVSQRDASNRPLACS